MREYKFMKQDKVKALAHLSSFIDEMKDGREYVLTLKLAKRKRSLNANNYAWALIDKLAEVQNMAAAEIYRAYIKDVGGNMECVTVSDNAVSTLCELWQSKGLGWQTETAPTPYEGYTDVFLYYGSSTFDSRTMARLIDLIVQDCKEQGIETLEDMELQRLVEEWERHEV